MGLAAAIREARERERLRAAKVLAQYQAYEREHAEEERAAWGAFLSRARPANVADYVAWLIGYAARGGEITHCHDHLMPLQRWVVLDEPCKITPLFGASSRCIIVSAGIEVEVPDRGHHSIYFVDGFRVEGGYDYVPVYSDIQAEDE